MSNRHWYRCFYWDHCLRLSWPYLVRARFTKLPWEGAFWRTKSRNSSWPGFEALLIKLLTKRTNHVTTSDCLAFRSPLWFAIFHYGYCCSCLARILWILSLVVSGVYNICNKHTLHRFLSFVLLLKNLWRLLSPRFCRSQLPCLTINGISTTLSDDKQD